MKLNIGETIKKLRKEREITQEEFAELLGVSCQSVSRWENNVCYPDMELRLEATARLATQHCDMGRAGSQKNRLGYCGFSHLGAGRSNRDKTSPYAGT